jgi:serine/threonine protein kinase
MHESQTAAAIPNAVTTAVQSSLTAAYAAPEVLLRKPSGPEADIFAVGVCLWQATFGDMPKRDVATFGLTTESKQCIATPNPVNNLLRVLLADDVKDRPSAMDALLFPYFADTHEVSRQVKKNNDKKDVADRTCCLCVMSVTHDTSHTLSHPHIRWQSSMFVRSSTSHLLAPSPTRPVEPVLK